MIAGGNWWRANEIVIAILPGKPGRATVAVTEPSNPIRGAVAVLEMKNEPCGYALLVSSWSNEFGGEICAIDQLFVEPEFRGRGFTAQFIQRLARGDCAFWPRLIAMITVEAYRTNPRAKALYERLGFKVSTNHSLRLVLTNRGPVSLSGGRPS
jgi:GNAT superfamily N-acetyltransferase